MDFSLNQEILTYIENSVDEAKALLEQICRIPAPSNHEEKRAEFCRDWLLGIGAEGTYIDSALNVIFPMNCEGRDDITVFMAHTDVVFPDTDPLPYREDEKNIYSPGVGDDTVCLVMILMAVKYVLEKGLRPKNGMLFVANSGEEGLGNLKGTRQLMNDYAGRIREVYTFDGQYNALVTKCVGSHRYRVIFETEGGHSFGAFGNPSAIHAMSALICRLYACEVPQRENTKTTYNVGIVEGGTSVNTIAQRAEMMYEYRSDDKDCLDRMKNFFFSEIERAQASGKARITVETIGIRPCGGDVDEDALQAMIARCVQICEKYSGIPCKTTSGSTDCNIPMSLGIPAVCPGVYRGGGSHTREEWLEKDSIPVGMKIAFELILGYFA